MNKDFILMVLAYLINYSLKFIKLLFKAVKYTLLYTLTAVVWLCMHVIAYANISKRSIHDSLNEAAEEVTDDGSTWAATDTRATGSEVPTLHDAG